jgi:hypothetical protein
MKVSRMAQEGLAFSSGLKNRLFDVGLKTRWWKAAMGWRWTCQIVYENL